jgi:hypothetical protein
MKLPAIRIIAIFALTGFAQLLAQDRLELEGTAIIGNKELPNILYIVPWKSVQRFEISTPPIVSIMEQKLTAIDRASFKRKIHYHNAIFSKAKPNP